MGDQRQQTDATASAGLQPPPQQLYARLLLLLVTQRYAVQRRRALLGLHSSSTPNSGRATAHRLACRLLLQQQPKTLCLLPRRLLKTHMQVWVAQI